MHPINLLERLRVRSVDIFRHETLTHGSSLEGRSEGVHHVDLFERKSLGLSMNGQTQVGLS